MSLVIITIIKHRGNHLSDVTCLTRVSSSAAKYVARKLWWSLTRRNTHTANEAALDK